MFTITSKKRASTRKVTKTFILISTLGLSSQVFAKSISMDVFAIPSHPITELVKQTSSDLKKDGIQTFYEKGFPIHTTLYLTDFPESAEDKIKQAVEKIAAHYHAFPLQAKGFTVTKGNWAFIDVDWSTQLQRLADEVTLAIEPLRDTKAPMPDWVKYYPNKMTSFERYGSPNVFQNFQPHLTLLANEKNPNLAAYSAKMQANPPSAQGQVTGIGIGITDEFGQQKKVIAKYMFK